MRIFDQKIFSQFISYIYFYQIDDILSKFEFIFPRVQRSQSEPCLIRNPQDDLLGLSMSFGVPKTPLTNHRRFNAEVS